jgi:hypothetical protein
MGSHSRVTGATVKNSNDKPPYDHFPRLRIADAGNQRKQAIDRRLRQLQGVPT